MIRIIHLITDLNTGGAEMMLYRLLMKMDKNRFKNQVVSLIPVGVLGEKIQDLGIPVHSLEMQPGRATLHGLLRLVRMLRHERPDILQTWLYHANLLGMIAAQLARIHVVIWNVRASNMDMSRYRRLSGLVLRICAWFSHYPEAVIVNSRSGQDFHTRLGYRPRRWVSIPNGIDVDLFKPNPSARRKIRHGFDISKDTLIIGLIARYDPMKDHETFVNAAGILKKEYSYVNFLLVGEGVDSKNCNLTQLIRRNGLLGSIHLLGLWEVIHELTAALDIVSSSSSYGEGFPNTIAEAMACGIPCVVTDVGDSAYLVGETGIVVPPRDPQALADGWNKLIRMGAKNRRALGLAARQRICDHFDLVQIVKQYEQLYKNFSADIHYKHNI